MKYLQHIESFSFTNERSYFYRKNRNGSLSGKWREHQFQNYLRIADSIITTFTKKGLMTDGIRNVVDQRIVNSALWCCQALLFSEKMGEQELSFLLEDILENETLKEAVSRSPQLSSDNGYLRAIKAGSVNQLIHYWKKETGQYTVKNIAKALFRSAFHWN